MMKKIVSFVVLIASVMTMTVTAFAQDSFDEDYYPWCESNHTFEIIKGKEPTCTQSGLTDYEICTTCGLVCNIQQEIPATGHSFSVWMIEISPTVTRKGLNYRICENCGEKETVETETIKYLAGDFDNNGRITPTDARMALRMSVGLEIKKDFYVAISDLNGDGMLTVSDARKILRIAVGLESI